MATNLETFTSSYDIRRYVAYVTPERRHLGRYCSEAVAADSGKQRRRRPVALNP